MKTIRAFSLLLASILLTGCLFPEKFSASITVKPDASYTYKYDGTAVNVLALAMIREKGSLPAKDEASLRAEAEKASKSPSVKKLNYNGNGRYELVIDELVAAGKQPSQMSFVSFTKGKDSIYSIAQSAMKPKDSAELKTLGLKPNGKLDIVIPAEFEVLSHNAKSAPGIFAKSYSWEINNLDSSVSIKFKAKSK
jgi:hypothetical protein